MLKSISLYQEQYSFIAKIAESAWSFLRDLKDDNLWDNSSYLKDCFSQNTCPEIDYNHYTISFAYTYFLENFLKATSVFLQESPQKAKCIIDAGCGSGAGMLAYLAVLDQSLSDTKWQIDVIMIDRSEEQLNIAMRILESMKPLFQHLDIVLHRPTPMNLLDWEPLANSADFILFEHVLTENPFYVSSLLAKAFLALADGGKIYIIERKREKEPIWGIIDQIVSELAVPKGAGSSQVNLDDLDFGEPWQFPSLTQKAEISTDYLVLQAGEQHSRLTLVDQLQRIGFILRYFQAWKNQSVDLLEKIFAPHAKYYEKPYKPPIEDLVGIKDYWRENVLRQSNICVNIINTSFAAKDASVSAEWEAEFTSDGLRVQLHGMLIMEVDLEQGYVVEFREYFRSNKTLEFDS